MSLYQPPEWSSAPQHPFSLEVIKDGCIVGDIALADKEFFVIGRQHDVVDIPADHPSISRRHAVINFHKDGSVMIKDLNSAQGTVLNKQLLPKDTFVPLRVGDVVRFAASSRIYVLKGPETLRPEEIVSKNLERLREKSESRLLAMQAAREKQSADTITWGMDLEEEEDGDGDADDHNNDASGGSGRGRKGEESDYFSGKHRKDLEDDDDGIDDSRRRYGKDNLPDYLRNDEHYDRKYKEKFSAEIRDEEARSAKDKELLEKIRKKERKVQNMQDENRRIFLKEQSQENGLTEGQLAAVSRNDKNIAQLAEEIRQLTEQIRVKYDNKSQSRTEDILGKRYREDPMEEDVLDTTKETFDSTTNWRLRKKLLTGISSLSIPVTSMIRSTSIPSSPLSGSASAVAAAASSTSSLPSSLTLPLAVSSGTAISYQEIKEALEQCQQLQASVQQQLAENAARANHLTATIRSNREKEEDLDAVIQENELKDVEKQTRSLQQEEGLLKDRCAKLRAMLSVAAPALKSLVGGGGNRPPAITPPESVTSRSHVDAAKGLVLPASPVVPSQAPAHSAQAVPSLPIVKDASPSTLSPRVDALMPPPMSPPSDRPSPVALPRRRSNSGEVVTSKGSENEMDGRNHGQPRPMVRKAIGPSLPAPAPAPAPSASASAASGPVLQGGDLVWVPPKQQKGDGRTSLNDKLGY